MALVTLQRDAPRKPGQVLNNYLKFKAAASRKALNNYLSQLVFRDKSSGRLEHGLLKLGALYVNHMAGD